jgi:hypothetical protein
VIKAILSVESAFDCNLFFRKSMFIMFLLERGSKQRFDWGKHRFAAPVAWA